MLVRTDSQAGMGCPYGDTTPARGSGSGTAMLAQDNHTSVVSRDALVTAPASTDSPGSVPPAHPDTVAGAEPTGTVAPVQQRSAPSARWLDCRRTVLIGALTVVSMSACSSSASPHQSPTAATFNDEGVQQLNCMTHQKQQPTAAYQAGGTAVSRLELAMLRYYTANGNKPYCDGRPPTATDLAWLTLYVHDGADPIHVRRYLNPQQPPASAG